jgi:hypothetical protein
MFLGFLMMGIAAGLVSAGTMLGLGQGMALAFLAYVLAGTTGFGLALALSLMPHRRGDGVGELATGRVISLSNLR